MASVVHWPKKECYPPFLIIDSLFVSFSSDNSRKTGQNLFLIYRRLTLVLFIGLQHSFFQANSMPLDIMPSDVIIDTDALSTIFYNILSSTELRRINIGNITEGCNFLLPVFSWCNFFFKYLSKITLKCKLLLQSGIAKCKNLIYCWSIIEYQLIYPLEKYPDWVFLGAF